MPKIIVYIPVKNDAWFIENAILSSTKWADHVFVLDESSDDGSHEIYKDLESELKNLTVIYNRPKFDFNTSDLRNYALDMVREFNGENLIFELHADEIMSAQILTPQIKNDLLQQSTIGSALMFPWINLWDKPFMYRKDKSIWSNTKGWFAFRDDRKVKFEGAAFHGSRVPEGILKNKVEFKGLSVLHFQFLNLSMERSKQALYQIFERNHYPKKNIEYINKMYACAYDERQINLVSLGKENYQPWLNLGIPINNEYPQEGFNWRDLEVLKNFKIYGLDNYKDLNIWNIDWEKKRKTAKKKYPDSIIPEKPIVDPRDFSTKKAHSFLMKYQMYPFWRINFFKLLIEKLMTKLMGK